ncbi:outer membrane protein assembly factor BamC [Shewanella surugensis]|uniref:Outer membrane protein assembly factor BamC n=1 Tax=Shewanella surugensis TaxID=212020 RepID=A0ABT0LHB8_9GAMM|nr:outer membrane protein assembly factor BamC [Shewanella surugensis]MCL1126954.1 outer membrane protein assembly factor BamC [Shewanella surugensis]
MLKQVTPLILIVAVSACSTSMERRQADGAEKYANTKATSDLIIPTGLLTPKYSLEYAIPPLGAKADPKQIGPALDIRPPLQVLPMAEGTRVEEGDDNIKVVVETIGTDVDLKQELFSDVKEYLAKEAIKIRQEDFDAGSIETDWITTKEVVDSSMWGEDKVFVLRQRYLFDITVSPHGRTGDLTISLVEHEQSYNGEPQDILLTAGDKRRYTIDMLNEAVSYIGIKREHALKNKRLQDSQGIDVSLIDDGDESPYWLADAGYKRTWERLSIVLPEMGFDITDTDPNLGVYFVKVEDDSGFWSSIWSDNDVTLPEGDYRITLKDVPGDLKKTSLYLTDADDKAVSDEMIKQVYATLSDLMQEKRKVR